jgi:hypothetical protein
MQNNAIIDGKTYSFGVCADTTTNYGIGGSYCLE